MKKSKFLSKNFFIVAIMACFCCMPVFAASNAVLSGIEITSNDSNSYQIMIKANDNVPIDKHLTASNKMVLDIKNVKPSKFVNTVYKNAPNIDHVIVQPVSDNQVRVFIQGRNIANSNILLDTRLNTNSDTQLQNSQQLNASAPLETLVIKPKKNINNEIEDINGNELKEFYNNEYADGTLTINLGSIFNKTNFDWLLRFLALVLMIFAGVKILGNKEGNVKINLSEQTTIKDREIDLLKSLNEKREMHTQGLKTGSTIRERQGDAAFRNYGLNEYKNSEYPKYYSTKGQERVEPKFKKNPLFQNNGLLNNTLKNNFKRDKAPLNKKKTQTMSNNIKKTQTNLDNIKFLEAMAQIYEKSGRQDLAQGLKKNISKARKENIA